jgi:F-type H+-transporting ATPase subunit b
MFKLRLVCVLALMAGACCAVTSTATGQDVEETTAKAEVSAHGEVAEHAASAHAADSHGHGSHEIDPTHANMTDQGEDPAEWRSEKAIATMVIFGLLLLGLSAVAWKPIAAGLEKREKTIASNISNAEKAAKEATAKLAEYEAKLATAAQESQQILADARKDAEATGQRLIATAQEEAARQRDRAVADIESAKRLALNELAQQSTDVAMTLAQRIVGREVNAADHQVMIQDMLKKLPSHN